MANGMHIKKIHKQNLFLMLPQGQAEALSEASALEGLRDLTGMGWRFPAEWFG